MLSAIARVMIMVGAEAETGVSWIPSQPATAGSTAIADLPTAPYQVVADATGVREKILWDGLTATSTQIDDGASSK